MVAFYYAAHELAGFLGADYRAVDAMLCRVAATCVVVVIAGLAGTGTRLVGAVFGCGVAFAAFAVMLR
ncbi:hypothetical protein E4K72_05975 [Oxalobacteraceae bacterium OM1]|nr:hypothetical protein E4K72_05975 [Oxalobacteraceae bacterium OM1]